MVDYYSKYLKYKKKYLNLKGGDISISVNLLWLNNIIKPENRFIFPDKITKDKDYVIVDIINDWKLKGYKLFLWYSSLTVTQEQLINTRKVLNDVTLLDVNEIFTDYQELFKCQLYIKIDFLKLLILNHQKTDFDYSIFTDIPIKPINKNDIIENDFLNKYKILLSRRKQGEIGNNKIYENNFIAIKNDVILNKNLEYFVINSYNIIIINKLLNGFPQDCSKAKQGEEQIYFDVLIILIYMMNMDIFYDGYNYDNFNKDINNVENIYKLFYSKPIDLINDTLPYVYENIISLEQLFPFQKRLILQKYDEIDKDDEGNKEFRKSQLLKNKITINYYIPTIDLERPFISNKYTEFKY